MQTSGMTIYDFRDGRPQRPGTPARSGEPWTDDDYETLVRLCRAGADAAAVADALQRSAVPVLTRAKRLLPVAERGLPLDRTLTQLRRHLEDPDYDWAKQLATSPPPRPVVNNVHPPALHTGVPGLTDEQLVAVAYAFSWAPASGVSASVSADVAREVSRRRLLDALRRRFEADSENRLEELLYRDETSRPYW